MPCNARLTDLWSGICVCHDDPVSMTGTIITASPNRTSGGLPQARLTDITIGSCGHTGIIVSSSSTEKTNGLGNARIGDNVVGCNIGCIITGHSIQTIET